MGRRDGEKMRSAFMRVMGSLAMFQRSASAGEGVRGSPVGQPPCRGAGQAVIREVVVGA